MTKDECLFLAMCEADKHGWDSFQFAEYYDSLCVTCGVGIYAKNKTAQKNKPLTPEQIEKQIKRVEKANIALERAKIQEEKARIRWEKAKARAGIVEEE